PPPPEEDDLMKTDSDDEDDTDSLILGRWTEAFNTPHGKAADCESMGKAREDAALHNQGAAIESDLWGGCFSTLAGRLLKVISGEAAFLPEYTIGAMGPR
ncbi:hypothetical protein CYMTET_46094, partial [Cymbomonas tetramitiformis]